jgi:phosphate:Na+ symporter
MVVSFVNAGLMNLSQAAGVILGANIGTTVTSQLVSINLSEVAPVILLLGVLVGMFWKKQSVKQIAEIVIGFGVLFVGLKSMSSAMAGVRDMPEVVDLLASLTNPFLATLTGFVLTAIIQSSSVTVSIVLLMANQNLLDLPITLFIIMGCNIGSCVTALLASLSGKKDAKRAALIHFWFNVIGTVLMYIVLMVAIDPIVNLIQSISADNGRFVANAHTIIKVTQVIILFPFTNWIVKLASWCVPGEDRKISYRENHQLKYIGEKVVFNPATAVVEVIKELERMASLANENLNRAMNALITLDEEDIEEVYRVEKNINFLNHAITDYLVKINQSTLPIEDLKSIGALFHVANDIERIGDHAENVADAARQRKEDGVSISKEAQKELGEMLEMVNKIIQYSIDTFAKSDESHLQEIVELENKVDDKEKELQRAHVERLTRGECTPEAGMIFSDIVSGLERVSDHATNIAFSIAAGDLEAEDEEI